MKTLVVCYSNSGTTTVVAERIARQLGADLEVIEEAKPRPPLMIDGKVAPGGGGAMARAALAAFLGTGAAIRETRKNPGEYDVVLVGTPVWAGSVAPAVRTYLRRHRKTLLRVAFFCTAGDPTKGRMFKQMRNLARQEPVATVAVKMEDARSDACADSIAGFVEQIKACA